MLKTNTPKNDPTVRAQARERTPWTGRALFERSEHEAERGRGWPWLSKVGKHSWDALAEQIEGEVLAAARPVPEDAGDERQPDLLAVEKLSRARRLGEAIMRCRDNDCGVREIAAEIVSLLAAVPSVAQAPTPEDESAKDTDDRTHFVPADCEDAGWEGSTACGALPLCEPSSDLSRVNCLPCLRALVTSGRASTGTEDALRKALRPFEGCWSWGVDVQLADVGALENAARAVLAAARPVTGTGEER